MQRSHQYTSATLFVGILSFVDILSFRAISLEMLTADVEVLIDAYPNTTQVSQGTTVVMVCHVSGVPSDTTVTYQWSCPNYGCGARGLQSDGNIVSRREEGNMIAIDVVNDTDSGNYTCNVHSSGRSLGSATYRISNVEVGLVLTGKNGMIPLNSFLTSNSSVQPPFEGASGEYIRCGSAGGQPGWYNEVNVLVPMSTGNNHFNSAPDTGELWFNTMNRGAINREFRCSPQNGSLINLSSFIGYFFVHQNELNDTPNTTIPSTTANSITLSWSRVNMANGYHVSYRHEDLSILLPPTYIRTRGNQNRMVTLQDLEPGASYQINVWGFQYISGPTNHKVSSPFKISVTTSESAPTAPRHLTVVRSASTSVDLNWFPPHHPNGVIHYEIEYSTNESFVDSICTTINTASNSTYHTVPDVPKFPRHYFRVVAVNSAGVGRSLSSNMVDICLGMDFVPGSPTNTNVVSTNNNTSVISWIAPILGDQACNPREQLTYTVTIFLLDGSFVTNVTGKSITVDISFCMITSVRVVTVNSLRSSAPDVWRNRDGPLDKIQYPSPPAKVMVHAINTTCNAVVSWTPPTRGALACSGSVTYTVTVSTSTGVVIVRNVTSTNTTINVCSSAVTAVSVVAVNFVGSSKPGVWTAPTMVHCESDSIDSNGRIVGIFFGGFGLSTGIATVVFILVFCNRRRKIDKLEKIINKSPVKPEESQHTKIEVTANPSYQSVEVKLDKQKFVYDSVDTYTVEFIHN